MRVATHRSSACHMAVYDRSDHEPRCVRSSGHSFLRLFLGTGPRPPSRGAFGRLELSTMGGQRGRCFTEVHFLDLRLNLAQSVHVVGRQSAGARGCMCSFEITVAQKNPGIRITIDPQRFKNDDVSRSRVVPEFCAFPVLHRDRNDHFRPPRCYVRRRLVARTDPGRQLPQGMKSDRQAYDL